MDSAEGIGDTLFQGVISVNMGRKCILGLCIPKNLGNIFSHEPRFIIDGYGSDFSEVGVIENL